MVVEELANRVVLFPAGDPARRTVIPVGRQPHEVALSDDGRFAYVSNFGLSDAAAREGIAGNSISVIDIVRGVELRKFVLPAPWRAPHGVKLRPQAPSELFTNAEEGDRMVVLDAAVGRVERSFPLPPGVHNFLFSDDGRRLIATATTGAIYALDPDTGRVSAQVNIGSSVRGLAWTPGERQLLAARSEELVVLTGRLKIERRIPLPGLKLLTYPAVSPDGRHWFVPAVFGKTIVVLNPSTGRQERRIAAPGPLSVQIAPGGKLAYIPNVGPLGDRITVLDLNTWQTRDLPGFSNANGIAFSPLTPQRVGAP